MSFGVLAGKVFLGLDFLDFLSVFAYLNKHLYSSPLFAAAHAGFNSGRHVMIPALNSSATGTMFVLNGATSIIHPIGVVSGQCGFGFPIAIQCKNTN